MRVLVMNERATPRMSRRRVRRDFKTALSLRPTFVLWQELVRWRYYIRLLREVFRADHTWVHYFTEARNPVSVRKGERENGRPRWVVADADKHRLTRGVGWIPQPGRFSNEVVVSNTKSHARVGMVNSHFTNGKSNRRFSLRSRRARARLWERQYERTCEVVTSLYNRGISTIGAGDYNDRNFPSFHPDARWLARDGVMAAWCLEAPGGATFEVNEVRVIPTSELETDHAAILIDVTVVPAAR